MKYLPPIHKEHQRTVEYLQHWTAQQIAPLRDELTALRRKVEAMQRKDGE